METTLEREVFQFDKAHASVIYKVEPSAAIGGNRVSLEVMVIDQYRYQREFSLRFTYEPGNSANVRWEWHIYQHPSRRNDGIVSDGIAKRFIQRFLELCRDYPALLFNESGDHATDAARPRCEGFVHLAEALHLGAPLSVSTLNNC